MNLIFRGLNPKHHSRAYLYHHPATWAPWHLPLQQPSCHQRVHNHHSHWHQHQSKACSFCCVCPEASCSKYNHRVLKSTCPLAAAAVMVVVAAVCGCPCYLMVAHSCGLANCLTICAGHNATKTLPVYTVCRHVYNIYHIQSYAFHLYPCLTMKL